MVCVKSEKYTSWVTPRPHWDPCRLSEAEVRILDFKTTWSEFQKPCQTAAMQGEAELGTYNLKKTSPPQSWSQAVVCASTPRMYPRSRYFLVRTIGEDHGRICKDVHTPNKRNELLFFDKFSKSLKV